LSALIVNLPISSNRI